MTNTAETTSEKLSTEERVAMLKDKLKAGLAALETDADWKRQLQMFQKAGPMSPARFSFNNQILLAVQAAERAEAGAPVDISAVATFTAWKESGRMVRKGEKALWVLRPNVCKNWAAIKAEEEKRGCKLDKAEADKLTFIRFGLMPVFAISQIEGEALPVVEMPVIETGDGWADACAALTKVALADGIPSVEFRAWRPGDSAGALGWCSLKDRSITVITDKQNRAEQFSTAVHELAHALLHCKDGKRDKHEYASNEVEAESISFVVCGAMGLDTSRFAFGYVARWAVRGDKDPVKQVEESGRRIAQTACKIIDALAGVSRGAADQEDKAAA